MKNMTLGQKISTGFGILILISAALGGFGSWQMKKAQTGSEMLSGEYVPENTVAAQIRGAANRAMYQMRGYGFTEEQRFYDAATDELTQLNNGIARGEELVQKAENLKKLPGQLAEIKQATDHYGELVHETRDAVAGMAEARQGLDSNATLYMQEAEAFLVSQQKAFARENEANVDQGMLEERMAKVELITAIINLGQDTRVKAFKAQATRDPEVMEDAQRNFPQIAAKVSEIRQYTKKADNLEQLKRIQAGADGYSKAMTSFLGNWLTLQDLGKQRDETGRNMIAACKTLQDAAEAATQQISDDSAKGLSTATTTTLVGLLVAVVLGVFLAVFMVRSITGPINKVINGMQAGSEQVSSAAGQVSASSQQLAEGASEQASSLEETAASLEMMSAGSKQSAENSRQANTHSQQVKGNAERGQQAMQGLNEAMEKIKNSSDETAKIIKTIDEIAFQTNLLALNAAVEAARAGDAGKGFAVVAEEVRNLAQRSAEAAKGTADLIDGAKANSDLGVQATAEVSTILEEVVGGIIEVSDLISEVSNNVEEQARSVGEINNAVAQMDTVTQSNAAGAEESASAAEEMSAQASEMRTLVQELVQIVGSNDGSAHQGQQRSLGSLLKRKPAALQGHSAPRATTFGSGDALGGAPRPRSQSAMDEVIPLDDDSLIEI